MSRESTLTSPSDRNKEVKFQLQTSAPPLTDEQTKEAMLALNNDSFVKNYPEVERRLADPPVDLQMIGLISFVPAKGATPNSDGIYGFAKLRGNFATNEEASARAEHLIRNVDSYHQIYHTYVGRPFPLTTGSDFSKEVNRIDIRKAAVESIAEDVRKKREKEQKDIEEIQQRQQELLEDVKKPQEDPMDRYTTLKVKKAQLTWTYAETEKKLQQMATLIAKARKEIEDLDRQDPSFSQTYHDKYMDARKKSGLSVDTQQTEQTFMRYLVEDFHIPSVEAEYQKLYGNQ